jgi:hypothetical protein
MPLQVKNPYLLRSPEISLLSVECWSLGTRELLYYRLPDIERIESRFGSSDGQQNISRYFLYLLQHVNTRHLYQSTVE